MPVKRVEAEPLTSISRGISVCLPGNFISPGARSIPTSRREVTSASLNSAPLARPEMATSATNFRFNLNSDITFGSVIIGGQTLAPGVYDAAALNGIAAGKFFDAGGSITVIPEPSVSMLCGAGLGVIGLAYARRGRRATR